MIAPQLYEPSTGTFSATGTSRDRTGHAATILADGRVLLVGGQDSLGILATADIYDPASGTFGQSIGEYAGRAISIPSPAPDECPRVAASRRAIPSVDSRRPLTPAVFG